MQQTETYKLNLIESSDTFSPDALNANTRKVEEAMLAHEEKVDGQVAEMDQRVTVLEGFKFACGSFLSDATPITIELGFTPKAVYIHRLSGEYTDAHILVTGDTTVNMYLHIVEGGFWHCSNNGYTARTGTYHYIALG